MARRPRIEVPGGLYHVLARGNERKAIFRDDADREDYLGRLSHYRDRFDLRVLAFCLMGNHLHLALERGRVPLSRIMLALQGSYTQAFNRRHGRVGHLFQGRYKAYLVDRDRYFAALLRYIHRNPVEAGLVETAERYRWSSARFYREGTGPRWLDIDRGLSLLAPRRSEALRNYRFLMRAGAVEAGVEPYDQVRDVAQVVKGDEEFARRVFEQADDHQLIRRSLRVETVARLVADDLGLDLGYLRGPTRRRNASLARALAGHLLKSHGCVSYASTAEFFHRDPSTLARDIRRLEASLAASRALRERVLRLAARAIDSETNSTSTHA